MFAIPAVVHCTLLHAGTDTRNYGGSPPSKSAPALLGCPFGLGPKNSFFPKGLRQLLQPGIPNWITLLFPARVAPHSPLYVGH